MSEVKLAPIKNFRYLCTQCEKLKTCKINPKPRLKRCKKYFMNAM